MLSGNSNPIAVQLLKENPDEIRWVIYQEIKVLLNY
jgi:hypothetical protein